MISEQKNLTVIRKNGALPSVPFLAIKEKILGKSFDLNIIFCSPEESKVKNKKYRNKNYPTNILSFPLSKDNGEIYICLSVARKEAGNFSLSYNQFLHLLVIHGCLHLKGMEHGSKMERQEEKFLNYFYRE